MITRCRLINNAGDIRDSLVEVEVKETWFGWHAVPPKKVDSFEFDHFSDLGVAVYLEAL